MSNKGAVIGLVLAFACGFGLAHNAQQPPEPQVVIKHEFVKVPEVITHVETKEINHPMPLPASCEALAHRVADMGDMLDKASTAAGNISSSLSDAGTASVMKDIFSINKATSEFNKYRTDLDLAAVGIHEDNNDVKPMLALCKKDMQPTER